MTLQGEATAVVVPPATGVPATDVSTGAPDPWPAAHPAANSTITAAAIPLSPPIRPSYQPQPDGQVRRTRASRNTATMSAAVSTRYALAPVAAASWLRA